MKDDKRISLLFQFIPIEIKTSAKRAVTLVIQKRPDSNRRSTKYAP